MKFFSVTIQPDHKLAATSALKFLPLMVASLRDLVAMLVAVLMASGIILLFVWAAGMTFGVFVGAFCLGMGFIFLALAMDNHGTPAVAQTATGLALLALALLQSRVSPDFVIVSGVLLSGWLGFALFRYVSRQDW